MSHDGHVKGLAKLAVAGDAFTTGMRNAMESPATTATLSPIYSTRHRNQRIRRAVRAVDLVSTRPISSSSCLEKVSAESAAELGSLCFAGEVALR